MDRVIKFFMVIMIIVFAGTQVVFAQEAAADVKEEMVQQGMSDTEAEDISAAADDLVKEGISPEEAGNIVSQAAHQAKQEGLKGRDLADRVHKAIEQRKQQRLQAKEQKKEQKQEKKQERKQKHKQNRSSSGKKGSGKGKR